MGLARQNDRGSALAAQGGGRSATEWVKRYRLNGCAAIGSVNRVQVNRLMKKKTTEEES